jgi:undecaprenyl-diphosphatase
MLEWLLNIDQAVFLFINGSLANPITDALMPVITNDWLLRIVYGLALIGLLVAGRGRFVWVVVFSALVVALSDQSSSAWLKPAFERLRPCKVIDVHLLVGCGAGYSFPSSHATNLFGQAVFFGLLYKKSLPYLLTFAFLVGVSRIFVGVHYPLDIIGGTILGSIWGLMMAGILWALNKSGRLMPPPLMKAVFIGGKRDRGNL